MREGEEKKEEGGREGEEIWRMKKRQRGGEIGGGE